MLLSSLYTLIHLSRLFSIIQGKADFGLWEAFAWDGAHGYTTNDANQTAHQSGGSIVRYTPDATANACLSASTAAGKWCALESGTHDWLKLNTAAGTFEWVWNLDEANPETYAGRLVRLRR